MYDNAPVHRHHLFTTYKINNNIPTLGWPAQSPNANPIENVC